MFLFFIIKYLCVSESVLRMIHINGGEQFLWSFLAVNELPLWDRAGIQDPVSVSETVQTLVSVFSFFLIRWYISRGLCWCQNKFDEIWVTFGGHGHWAWFTKIPNIGYSVIDVRNRCTFTLCVFYRYSTKNMCTLKQVQQGGDSGI